MQKCMQQIDNNSCENNIPFTFIETIYRYKNKDVQKSRDQIDYVVPKILELKSRTF